LPVQAASGRPSNAKPRKGPAASRAQDTRRLLQEEAANLHAELQRRDAAARYCAESARAEDLVSTSDLGRLQEQLAATEAKLDRAKQVWGAAGVRGAAGGSGEAAPQRGLAD
jgi:hypothetical protein